MAVGRSRFTNHRPVKRGPRKQSPISRLGPTNRPTIKDGRASSLDCHPLASNRFQVKTSCKRKFVNIKYIHHGRQIFHLLRKRRLAGMRLCPAGHLLVRQTVGPSLHLRQSRAREQGPGSSLLVPRPSGRRVHVRPRGDGKYQAGGLDVRLRLSPCRRVYV